MTIDLHAARTFIDAEARLLEQRVAQVHLDGGDPDAVVRAVAAFANPDGGFGHGLEPDKRTPDSQPLDVEVALQRLVAVGARAPELVRAACDYLASVADEDGAVPIAFPSVLEHPHATHWDEIPLVPGHNPTASIAGYLHALGADHPWLTRATEWCFRSLETDGPPPEVHALRCVTRLLEHAPDRERAERCARPLAEALPGTPMYQDDPDAEAYGLTPLEFAPTPTSFGRPWFSDDSIEAHLDGLERRQQADGGWPIAWEPPSVAATCDWRGIVTVEALEILAAYGRLPG
jgi:hypothetical protein